MINLVITRTAHLHTLTISSTILTELYQIPVSGEVSSKSSNATNLLHHQDVYKVVENFQVVLGELLDVLVVLHFQEWLAFVEYIRAVGDNPLT